MCASPSHPVLALLRARPELVIHALHRRLGWELEQPMQAVLADVGDTQLHLRGHEWSADLAVELRRFSGSSSWLAVVVTSDRDDHERGYLWPCYAALLGLRRGGPASLLAIVPAAEDVAWARQTVSCGFGALTFTPLAIAAAELFALCHETPPRCEPPAPDGCD